MAMRFYLANVAEPVAIGANYNGGWNATDSPFLGHLRIDKSGSASISKAETTTTTNWDVLLGRWVSDPMLRTGTLAGTVQWVLGLVESHANANMHVHLYAYITQGDTTQIRGVLLNDYVSATEFPTTAEGQASGVVAVEPVDCQVGDRLVVEVGYQARNTSATSYTGTLYYGGTGSPDLTGGSTNVTSEPGWIEFSHADDVFRPPASTYVLEQYAPFDTGRGADMTESVWRFMFRHIYDDGVIATQKYPAEGDELKVFANSTGMQVHVRPGECWIQGHWGEILSQRTLPITASNPSLDRIDFVVARNNFITNRIELDVVLGTPAASPTPPPLTRNSSIWEIPLALVRVPAGATTISASDITDYRVRTGYGAFTHWEPPLYWEGAFGSGGANPVNLGTGVNSQTGWPAGRHGRWIKMGTFMQVRYDFRWASTGINGGTGRIYTTLPPGFTATSHGVDRLQCHLWVQEPSGADSDWNGTALVTDQFKIYPFFNRAYNDSRISWYINAAHPAAGTGTGCPQIPGYYPEGGSLVISGVVEVKE